MLNCIILGSEQEAKIFSVVKEAEIKALYKKIIELVMESETASQLLLSCPDLDKEERASIEKRLSLAKGILVSFENNSSGDPFLIHALEEEVKKIKDCPKSK